MKTNSTILEKDISFWHEHKAVYDFIRNPTIEGLDKLKKQEELKYLMNSGFKPLTILECFKIMFGESCKKFMFSFERIFTREGFYTGLGWKVNIFLDLVSPKRSWLKGPDEFLNLDLDRPCPWLLEAVFGNIFTMEDLIFKGRSCQGKIWFACLDEKWKFMWPGSYLAGVQAIAKRMESWDESKAETFGLEHEV